jgi:hypothetical protein
MFRTASFVLKQGLRPLFQRYQRQLTKPRETQAALLARLVGGLSTTGYGQAHKLKAGDDYESFAAKLPLATYDDLEEWIARQQESETLALVPEPVLFYEKTSGSSGAAKLIPYTRSLKASFNRMFYLWLCDLLENGPRFRTGRTYLSVSPAFRQSQQTALGLRVGLDDDTEYLAGWMARLLRPFLAVSPKATRIQTPDQFKLAVSVLLLAQPRLEIISLWNPSLLDLLLEFIVQNREPIHRMLKTGALRCDGINFRFPAAAASRIEMLEETPIPWEKLWPELKLISCWTGAHAAMASRVLAQKFPGVYFQGKGLLATEAPLTIPLIKAGGCTPLPAEVFYEFLDDEGRVSQLHELHQGQEYEVILTQKGGFARYRIGDRVRVTGSYLGSPCLEFIGRADAVSDLVGEKLHEVFVRGCLEKLSCKAAFQTLVPMTPEFARWHYVLLIEDAPAETGSIEQQLESELCASYHYRNARLLGQLDRVRVRVAPRLKEAFYRYFTSKGMKWGDIKHRHLIRKLDDAEGLLATIDLHQRGALFG